jgi:uncharacterized repeat protein (TIGR01451 family)
VPFERRDTQISYFVGDDPSAWRTAVPVWGGVRYEGLYEGIDLELTGTSGNLVQRLVVSPNANLAAVRLRVEGADAISTEGANLRLDTPLGPSFLPLLAVVTPDGAAAALPEGGPTISGGEVARPFAVQVPDSSAGDLAPQVATALLYSTFLGGDDGANSEIAGDLAVDSTGAAYITGYTISSNFPDTAGVIDRSHNGSGDIFVAKLSPDGSGLIFGTFLGGSEFDRAYNIDVGSDGQIYLTGFTRSANFPKQAAIDNQFGGGDCGTPPNTFPCADIFVAKLNPNATALVYSTYIGRLDNNDAREDSGYGITSDGSGAAYVTGTYSHPSGDFDVFVLKLDDTGGEAFHVYLFNSSYPATGYDEGDAIAVDQNGGIYIRGFTTSTDFYVSNAAYQQTPGSNGDAFISKLNPSGTFFEYSTYFGGALNDGGFDLTLGIDGSVFISGYAESQDIFGSFTPSQGYHGGPNDAFLARFTADLSTLTVGTFLGGNSTDFSNSSVLDSNGAILVAGGTESSNLTVSPDAYDSSYNGGNGDGFMLAVDSGSGEVVYGTYLGGGDYDELLGLAHDGSSAIMAGYSRSSNYPTTAGAFDQTRTNGSNFVPVVSKLGEPPPDLTLTKSHTGNFAVGTAGTYTLRVSNDAGAGTASGPISVDDTLPTGMTFASAAGEGWSCSAVGQIVTCTHPGPLAPGASLPDLLLTVNVAAEAVGDTVNTATVSTAGESVVANNGANDPTTTAPLPPVPPDLSLSKSHDGELQPGANAVYRLRVSNATDAGATSGAVSVVDTLPAGMTFASAAGEGWGCAAVDQAITCTHPGPLAPGASLPDLLLTVSLAADLVGSIVNNAAVSTANETNGGNNTASDTVLLAPRIAYLPLMAKEEPPVDPGPPSNCEDREPNNTRPEGFLFKPSGQTCTGSLDGPDVTDYYAVELTAGQHITIRLTGIPSGADYDLYLYDSVNNLRETSDESGNKEELIEYTATETGRHYIRVFELTATNRAPNTYQLTASVP